MTVETMYDAIRFKFRNTPVTVMVQNPVEEFTVQDNKYGPYEKGQEVDLPRWVAEVLFSQDMVKFKDAEVDLPKLQKAVWRETSEPVLQELPSHFFFQVKQQISQIARKNIESPNSILLSTQTKMEQLLRDLIASRLIKLMKIALREERIHESKERMTEEENWLIDQLINLLRNWEKHILELDAND
jgi:hypothetical protein